MLGFKKVEKKEEREGNEEKEKRLKDKEELCVRESGANIAREWRHGEEKQKKESN